MKKVINNKVYDTEKAKRCGEYEPSPYRSDFHWFCETLYQKKTGEFFLHGDGNAASKYSKSCGQNEWCGSEKIIPLTYEEAQSWAEKHLDGEECISIFGEPEEEIEGKRALNVQISESAYLTLKQEAAKRGITLGACVEGMIINR